MTRADTTRWRFSRRPIACDDCNRGMLVGELYLVPMRGERLRQCYTCATLSRALRVYGLLHRVGEAMECLFDWGLDECHADALRAACRAWRHHDDARARRLWWAASVFDSLRVAGSAPGLETCVEVAS